MTKTCMRRTALRQTKQPCSLSLSNTRNERYKVCLANRPGATEAPKSEPAPGGRTGVGETDPMGTGSGAHPRPTVCMLETPTWQSACVLPTRLSKYKDLSNCNRRRWRTPRFKINDGLPWCGSPPRWRSRAAFPAARTPSSSRCVSPRCAASGVLHPWHAASGLLHPRRGLEAVVASWRVGILSHTPPPPWDARCVTDHPSRRPASHRLVPHSFPTPVAPVLPVRRIARAAPRLDRPRLLLLPAVPARHSPPVCGDRSASALGRRAAPPWRPAGPPRPPWDAGRWGGGGGPRGRV